MLAAVFAAVLAARWLLCETLRNDNPFALQTVSRMHLQTTLQDDLAAPKMISENASVWTCFRSLFV